MIDQIFGFPIYMTSIKSNSYNKKDIINIIERNYNKSPTRNYWDSNAYNGSDIHHSIWDQDNPNFEKPDYSILLTIYNKKIQQYLNELGIIKNTKYGFEIVNYTCMIKGQSMRNHIHVDCDFSGVHYVSFDEKTNDSTLFLNTQSHSKYLKHLRQGSSLLFDNKKTCNSYLYENFKFITKEDDLIIFPSMLEHSIPKVNSDKKRITIAFNIYLENVKQIC
jgi:uncharacterized protein (TIGR02466 family)